MPNFQGQIWARTNAQGRGRKSCGAYAPASLVCLAPLCMYDIQSPKKVASFACIGFSMKLLNVGM